jgi:HD-GYP domain-containing protein (c-di-GMP phosphodiesterase class II)
VLGGLLDYLILPLWLGSLYIELRRLALLIVMTIIGLLVFPLLSPTVTLNTILIGPFSFLLITSVILLVITYYRNKLEHDRRVALSSMFVQVQRTNEELSQAYETTIEGWSLALDLRDKETEGHSRRVTDMTLLLAQTCGCSDAELLHIRRGALLHDIGKMGVPDRILLKDGPLTQEEWAIMRRHPIYAYEMLLPINYLRQALDIPYCHHEKWDGSGYPRGLKGEQIPLAARIFALVDVWDALTSDRPYRKAWPSEKARVYMRAQVGTHFDPDLVELFLGMLDSASYPRPPGA